MINLSSTSPVSRPAPVSTAVAPVPATPAIKPVASENREPAADMDSRRDLRRPRVQAGDNTAAPAPQPGRAGLSERQASAQVQQDAAAQRAGQAQKKAEADKAMHHQAMDRLREALTNMWAASAAVIDQALGLEPKAEALPGNQSDTAPDLSAVAASTLSRRLLAAPGTAGLPGQPPADPWPWPVMPPSADEAAAPEVPEVPGGEVVAYDEHGNSSLAPLETGTLLSEKA